MIPRPPDTPRVTRADLIRGVDAWIVSGVGDFASLQKSLHDLHASREDSPRVTRAKARLRVALDKQLGRTTPDSVIRVAEGKARDE